MNSTESKLQFPPIEVWKDNARLAVGSSSTTGKSPRLPTPNQGVPRPVFNLRGTQQVVTHGNARYAQINLTHDANTNDLAFDHTNIWASGYLGNPNPQKIAGGTTSGSHSVLLPLTGETVSLTVQSVGKDGSLLPLSKCPTSTHTLA